MAPRSRRSRSRTHSDTATDPAYDYQYDYQEYGTQDADTTTSRASSSSSSASQEEEQEEEHADYSDSSEESGSDSSSVDQSPDDDENQEADYDYEYVYTTDSDSDSEQEQGATENADTDASYSQAGSSTDNENDNENGSSSDSNSGDTNAKAARSRPRNVPSGTRASQCSFQAAPKWLDSEELDALKSDCDQYIDYQASLVSQGGSDVESMMNGIIYYSNHHGVSGGNWLAFVPRSEASTAWDAVREANEEGRLGGYAELRTRDASGSNDCAIAVYVSDVTDVDNCADIYNGFNYILASTTSSARVASFKMALLSTLGIYRNGNNSDARYTFAQLGMKSMPMPDGFSDILGRKKKRGTTDNNGGGRRKRGGRKNKKRRNRGRGGGGGEGYYPKYTNRYYHGRRSSNTLPNGYWTRDNVEDGWVFHMGRYAQVTGRGGNHRSSTGEAKGCAILDAHRARLYSEGYISPSERRAVMRSLWETADRYDIVIGKWSVYVPAKVADSVWKSLCDANDSGELGGCIKLSPYNESTDQFMMVVYCNDFTETADCQRILYIVHNIVSRYGIDMIANFKPDFFSRIGVYRNRLLGTHVSYPLNELGLAKFWPHPELKRILDELKGR